jgi:CBS domain-containing protein
MAASKISGQKPVEEVFRKEKVGRLCRTEPAIAFPETPLAETLERLRGDSGGCVMVVEAAHPRGDGPQGAGPTQNRRWKPIGIFTERDYLDKVALLDTGVGPAALENLAIEKFMTSGPTVLSQEEGLNTALQVMTKGGYRHLPLVDGEGLLCGVLSVRDIIFYLAEFFPIEVMNLPPKLDKNQSFDAREGG